MREVIIGTISNEEIKSRKEYLENCFGIWFYPIKYENYVLFKSIPEKEKNLFLIVGHNINIIKFLCDFKIYESTIVFITCQKNILKQIENINKTCFISKAKDGYSEFYDGKMWNFNFNITKSELDFYNCESKMSLIEKLNYAYERI